MSERYEITRLIGKGATGGVYQAEDTTTGETVLVRRFFSNDGCTDTAHWELQFKEVIEQLSQVNHPNVTPVIEAGFDDDGAFVTTPFAETKAIHKIYDDGMDLDTFFVCARQLLEAIAALHAARLVHGNIGYESFIVKPGSPPTFILKDYGLRRIAPLIQGRNPIKIHPSSPSIMAPEHFEGDVVDQQTDIYMIGQLLYILICGGHPLAAASIDEARTSHLEHNYPMVHLIEPDIPISISRWIDSLTQPNKSDRYASAYSAIRALEDIRHELAEQEATPQNASPVEDATSPTTTAPKPATKPKPLLAHDSEKTPALTSLITVQPPQVNAKEKQEEVAAKSNNTFVVVAVVCTVLIIASAVAVAVFL